MKGPSSGEAKPGGFDAAIKRREEDYLNRWPFAQELYGIATTGPDDWSVRIGIYGEWGTGKTSVLQFISQSAAENEHILIHFNPWEHSSKQALWNSFANAVYDELERRFGDLEHAGLKRRKAWLAKAKELTQEAVSVYNEHLGKLVGSGLDLLKENFGFNEEEQKALKKLLNGKRIIVLIDDLDRTSPELVPEILFALKELMDLPGFSFICAFDPTVVGKVLRRYHAGFGDGLKFLEKIIDYPRWLPPAPPAGLVRLALADARKYCPYVPETALREVVHLLPANPRAVRQFIRLLAFLSPQISRHYDHELRWPIILAADALKVCYARLGHALLADEGFLDNLRDISFGAESGNEQKPDKKDTLHKHVKCTASSLNVPITAAQEKEIVGLLETVFSAGNILYWIDEEKISYQFNIAEAPHAVTRKEYDEFFSVWTEAQTRESAEAWIGEHAIRVNRQPIEVQREIFRSAIQRYGEALEAAETVLTEAEKAAYTQKVTHLISLVELLIFDLGGLDQAEKKLSDEDLELLFNNFTTFTNSLNPVHMQFQARNEAVLFKLIKEWRSDVMPLVKVLKPYGYFPGGPFDREETKKLRDNLSKSLLPNLARQVIDRFREPGFAKELFGQEIEMYAARGIILQLNGPMWIELRQNTFALFQEAATNPVVQENAFELLYFFDYKLIKEQGSVDAMHVKDLISDKEIAASVWAAATANPLSPAATSHLNQVTRSLKAAGADFTLPAWWDEKLKIMAKALETAKSKAGVKENPGD